VTVIGEELLKRSQAESQLFIVAIPTFNIAKLGKA
jgi:hypothetical protein